MSTTITVSRVVLLATLGLSCGLVVAPTQGATTTEQGNSASSSASTANNSATSSTSGTKARSNSSKTDAATPSALLLIVPLDWSERNAKQDGCWVKLYDGKNYAGDSFMLAGQQQLPGMKGPFGFNWQNRVKSIETGGKATVTIFDDRNYRDRDKVIGPGSKVPDLSAKMGYFDDFRSMKLACTA